MEFILWDGHLSESFLEKIHIDSREIESGIVFVQKNENAVEFDLSFTYEESNSKALDNVEGKIKKGECIVLCGKSGCGKSTLLRALNHLVPEFYEGKLTGYCTISGEQTENLSIGENGRLVSTVFQDPRSQFFTMNSNTEIAFGMENFGISRQEIIQRVEKSYTLFNVEKLRDRNVFSLSSGEKQIVAILAAWALDTDVLLLDEPTANLDYNAIEKLKEMLLSLKKQGKTIILSEHRLYYLKDLADAFWVIDGGKILKKIPGEEIVNYTQSDLSALSLRRINLKDGISRGGETFSPENTHVFEGRNIYFQYDKKDRPVLLDVSFKATTSDVIALIGANGCGKTTLGKIIAGLLTCKRGEFLYENRRLKAKELRNKCIFIMQEAEFQFFTNSVENELYYGKKRTEELEQSVNELLQLSGLNDVRTHHPFSLSGGQMQKLVMLIAYLSDKELVVLDEPSAGLDRQSLSFISMLIKKMQKEKTVFIITHDQELIEDTCTRCICLQEGMVKEDFLLQTEDDFKKVFSYRKGAKEECERVFMREQKHLLDPRTKMLLVLLSMIVGIWTDIGLIASLLFVIILCAIYERKYVLSACSFILMGTMTAMYMLFPNTVFSFIVHFFPRILIIMASVMLCITDEESPRTLAGMRKMRFSEKTIMIFSVMLRFFPVLIMDTSIMNQSIKTRGFFKAFSDKVKGLFFYVEILIVPMVFRVLRIAEALSASAETRGISLDTKRESYINIKFYIADYIIIAVTILAVAVGLLI